MKEIGFEKIKSHETKLRNNVVDGLKDTPNINLIEGNNLEYGPILSFMSEEIDSHDIAIILEDIGKIFVRSGALCTHLFMDEIGRDSLVQLSTHVYNSEEDIKKFNGLLYSVMEEI